MKLVRHSVLIRCILFLCSLSLSTGAFCIGEMYESAADITALAKERLARTITLQPDEKLDIQITASDVPQLTKCTKNIDVAPPKEFNRERVVSLELTCPSERPWHVFIPAYVHINTKVVVAKQPISPDAALTDDDLDYAEIDVNSMYGGFFKDKKEIVGYVAAQSISPSSVITKRLVHKAQLVRKNQPIELLAKKNSIVVSVKVVSHSDGGLNDNITVYNPSTKKLLQATVVGQNRAEVIF